MSAARAFSAAICVGLMPPVVSDESEGRKIMLKSAKLAAAICADEVTFVTRQPGPQRPVTGAQMLGLFQLLKPMSVWLLLTPMVRIFLAEFGTLCGPVRDASSASLKRLMNRPPHAAPLQWPASSASSPLRKICPPETPS